MRIWRICKASYASEAFDGKGAALTGGRWNHRGTIVVYCSESLALAALELFVNLNTAEPIPLVSIMAEIPDGVSSTNATIADLPANWRDNSELNTTREIGSDWVRSGNSAVLCVPSVLIPQERNYLLNPAHPDFKKVRMREPAPFSFDGRMWK